MRRIIIHYSIYSLIRKGFFLVAVAYLVSGLLFGNSPHASCRNTGFKFIKNFSRQDYGQHPQNWSIVQDKQGVIYVANNGGILEFDGVSWRFMSIPEHRPIRALAIDETDTIYIGSINEMGFLTVNPDGNRQYVSLRSSPDNSNMNFSHVRRIHTLKGKIYFRAREFLFCRDSQRLKTWKPKYFFDSSFVINGTLYIRDHSLGLMQMKNDNLRPVPGGEIFADTEIFMMAPYDSGRLLFATMTRGCYLYDGQNITPFKTELDDYLEEKKLYHGIRLSSGDFALATRLGGLVIMDRQGKLKQIFDRQSGLQDENVKYVFEDSQGNIWLGLNYGITKIEYDSPLSLYDEGADLPKIVLSITRHHHDLYVGTVNGLYVLKPFARKFRPVPNIQLYCWDLLPVDGSLLAATTGGVIQVGRKNHRVIIEDNSYVIHRSRKNNKRIWIGTNKGLVSLYKSNGHWQQEFRFEKDIKSGIRTIVENPEGDLWLGSNLGGVFKIESPSRMIPPKINRFDTSYGLPGGVVRIFWAANHVMFATETGIYRFDEINQRFIPDTTPGDRFTNTDRVVFLIAEDQNRNIWVHQKSRNYHAIPQPDGSYKIDPLPFLKLPDVQVNTIYTENNTIWLGSVDNLIRFDSAYKKNYHQHFSTLIRRVIVNGKPIFNGNKYKREKNSPPFTPVISYKNRNIRFTIAAPFFEAEAETRYRYFLKGYDRQWSDWTPDNQKEYTNLDDREYRFQVQARNVYGNIGDEAVFQFKILPPWYSTWWMFLFYALVFFLLLFIFVRWRSGKLEREKQKLEKIVKVRTKELQARTIEINEKNLQLESQTVQLSEQSEKLKEMDRVKSRFFANISHEFRTPLTLIMGPLEQMIASCGNDKKEKKRKLTLMLRNAQRLLRLINQLLELAKLDSGKLKLQAEKTDIISFLKGITDSFRFMAHQKELDLVFLTLIENELEPGNLFLYIDPRKMEDIMSNLLINAFKFTPPGGKITVTINKITLNEPEPHEMEDFSSPRSFSALKSPSNIASAQQVLQEQGKSFVEISVCDTGPGIPGEHLVHIFDRFYQAHTTDEYHENGTGIGLALSRELVELHHGTIQVKSRQGEGSSFILRLPMGNAHLEPDEIVNLPAAKAQQAIGLNISQKIPALETVSEKEEKEIDVEPGAIYDLEAKARLRETNIILVVEDSTDMRTYIKGALEPCFTVLEAGNGIEGIQTAQETIPDLIISDIMMPEVDGYELCRVLKKDIKTSHIPIILLTARASEENILHGLETGADDYITKPFNSKILKARVKNLIDIRNQLQKNINREMTLQPDKTSVSRIDREFLHELHEVINRNFSDEEFNVEQLRKKLYMGRTTLYRKVLALTGETPTDLIRSYRLKRGAELLAQNFGTVLDVAFKVGFSNSSYFAKCFKEKFHRLPSAYQASPAG